MPFVQCLWLEVFVEKSLLSHLKTPKMVAMETKVCHVINVVFKRGQNVPPGPQEQKKKRLA